MKHKQPLRRLSHLFFLRVKYICENFITLIVHRQQQCVLNSLDAIEDNLVAALAEMEKSIKEFSEPSLNRDVPSHAPGVGGLGLVLAKQAQAVQPLGRSTRGSGATPRST